MRKLLALLIVSLAVACASTDKPPREGRPGVRVRQSTPLFFGSGYTAPLSIEVTIGNLAKEPIRVRRVGLQSGPGMTQYSAYPASRITSEVLEPGQSTVVNMTMTAYTSIPRLQPTEPLSLRAFIDYEVAGKRHQEMYIILVVES